MCVFVCIHLSKYTHRKAVATHTYTPREKSNNFFCSDTNKYTSKIYVIYTISKCVPSSTSRTQNDRFLFAHFHCELVSPIQFTILFSIYYFFPLFAMCEYLCLLLFLTDAAFSRSYLLKRYLLILLFK